MEGMNQSGLVDQAHFQVKTLKASVQVSLSKFLQENRCAHQPIKRVEVCIIVIIVGFSSENCAEQIGQLSHLDHCQPFE